MPTSRRSPLLLLDTHVWWGYLQGDENHASPSARLAADSAATAGRLRVSSISVWELAMLEAKGRVRMTEDCLSWVRDALALPGVDLVPLSPDIAVASTRLPGDFHGDPADRILVATARALGATLVTKDRKILDYGKTDYVSVMPA